MRDDDAPTPLVLPANSGVVTTIGAEVWVADNPLLRVTRIGAEVWHPYTPFVPPPAFRKPLVFVVS